MNDICHICYMYLVYLTAFTIEEKLSSINTISEASLATSVPVTPIENPTCASFKAGPSLVPSPVTATTSCYKVDQRDGVLSIEYS